MPLEGSQPQSAVPGAGRFLYQLLISLTRSTRGKQLNENIRSKFAENEAAFGLWVTSESAAVTEVAAILGIDWLCIDMEHGYLDYRSIAGHLTAARGTGMTVLVRPPSHDLEPIKRALDLGAHGGHPSLGQQRCGASRRFRPLLLPPTRPPRHRW